MQEIYLNCVLMNSGEVMFLGKSVGFVKNAYIKKYALDALLLREAIEVAKDTMPDKFSTL